MEKNRKGLICVDLEEPSLKSFRDFLSKTNLTEFSEIHLVHSFETKVYAGEFFVTYLPTEDQYSSIEKSVQEVLNSLTSIISNRAQDLPVKTRCIFSGNPKLSLVEYAKENKIDKMTIATRGLHGISGIFASSFAEYMVRHAPCELQIIRES